MASFQVQRGDDTYTLEFTRATFAEIEQLGFSAMDVRQKPLSSTYLLFYGALRKNHEDTTLADAGTLLDELVDVEGYDFTDLFQALLELMDGVFMSEGKTKKKPKKVKPVVTKPTK